VSDEPRHTISENKFIGLVVALMAILGGAFAAYNSILDRVDARLSNEQKIREFRMEGIEKRVRCLERRQVCY
jgi:hypothetical protein